MKKILTFVILSVIANNAFAQGFYLKAGFDYAFTHGGGLWDVNGLPYSGNSTFISNGSTYYNQYDVKKVSLLTGSFATISGGYMINAKIGVELSGVIGISPAKYYGQEGDIKVTQYLKHPFLLTPEVIGKTNGKNIVLYGKAGLVLPINTEIEYNLTDPSPSIFPPQSEIRNTFNLGFTIASGLSLKINKQISIWAEASLLSLTEYAKEQNNTNGHTFLLLNRQGTSNTNPYMQATDAIPLSNISANAGIAISFGHKVKAAN